MNTEHLTKLSDPELTQVIAAAQELLKGRAEKRKNDAMEEIRRIAAEARIIVSFDPSRRSSRSKPALRAGDRYVNPADASEAFVVGKGKPPAWFTALRDKGRLPAPTAGDTLVVSPKA